MHSNNNSESLKDRITRAGITTIDGLRNQNQDSNKFVPLDQGDLKEKPIAWLLQVAQHYEITGHLIVGNPACSVNVQFGLGKPLNAYSPLMSGTGAIIELFTWAEGKYRFEDGKQPEAVSIFEGPEELVRQGEAYLSNISFLEKKAITEMSFLLRPPEKLDDAELVKRITGRVTTSVELHKDFYNNTYGTLNLKDIAERMALRHDQWTAIAVNLLKAGLLLGPDGKSLKELEATAKPVVLSRQDTTNEKAKPKNLVRLGVPKNAIEPQTDNIESVWKSLSNAQTSILNQDAFLFFLIQEFSRASRFGTTLSLISFCIKTGQEFEDHLPCDELSKLTRAIASIKRDVDLIGHLDQQLFGLLLPNVDSSQSCNLVDRIMTDLPKCAPDLGKYHPVLYFGIASAPEDAKDLNDLIRVSQKAMFEAANQNILRLQAKELAK